VTDTLAPQLSPAFPLAWSSERLAGTGTVVVSVAGELDRRTSPALRDHLEWWLGHGCDELVLDTADVTFADAGALDLLRAVAGRGAGRGCRVVLARTGLPLLRLVLLLGPPDGVELDGR
jgi:anti-anti-sigma factor